MIQIDNTAANHLILILTLRILRNLTIKTLHVLKIGVFWDVTPCGSCKNRRFGGTWRLLHQDGKNQ
jgi:hypothetical protein